MPDGTKSSGSPRPKPTTRSSLRQSLNLASVGKAFADVMGKDSKDSTKSSKKPKETSTRRLSVVSIKPPTASRASMDGIKPPLQSSKRTPTPDSKNVTRRRVSGALLKTPCEPPSNSPTPPTSGVIRSSTLRPRSMNGPSALPKYRPKSALVEPTKAPPSPVARITIRRRLSSSDDDTTTDDQNDQKSKKTSTQLQDSPSRSVKGNRSTRSISPVVQRSALKVNVSVVNATPSPSTPTKRKKSTTPSSVRASPSRPSKTAKATTASTTSLPRPSSSASSSAPHTPKGSGIKGVLGLRRGAQEKGKHNVTPTGGSSKPSSVRNSPSPISRHLRKGSATSSPANSLFAAGNLSHVSEGDNEDSEEEDVELLLAPVAALGAPTPSMPRIQKNNKNLPETPTRNRNLLPGRSNLSYASPQPPDMDLSWNNSSLRPPTQSSGGRVARGSILSWEQLASEASRTLGEDEIESMLSEIPAPFRSNPVSPTLSATMEIPESPCLSALNSPSSYGGSISQVLLPDVTPSPAIHHGRYSLTPDAGASDSGAATLLRLQLAAAENMAKERLHQMQTMEEEIHNLKEVHNRQMQETAMQMAYIEAQERNGNQREAYTTSLEDQLRLMQTQHEHAVEEAVARGQEMAAQSHIAEMNKQHMKNEATSSARVTMAEWLTVRELSEMELELVRGDRATLSVLLAELDRMCRGTS